MARYAPFPCVAGQPVCRWQPKWVDPCPARPSARRCNQPGKQSGRPPASNGERPLRCNIHVLVLLCVRWSRRCCLGCVYHITPWGRIKTQPRSVVYPSSRRLLGVPDRLARLPSPATPMFTANGAIRSHHAVLHHARQPSLDRSPTACVRWVNPGLLQSWTWQSTRKLCRMLERWTLQDALQKTMKAEASRNGTTQHQMSDL